MSTGDRAGFSVVIPIHGRAALLDQLLSSIRAAQRLSDVSIEIVVVDSTDGDKSDQGRMVCERHRARWLRGTLSVRQKRNLGARESRLPWLLFIDSDCRVSPHFFEAYYRFIASSDDNLSAAAGPTQFQGGETRFTRIVAKSSLLIPFHGPALPGRLLWATTSNLLVGRDTFERLGGFREDFPFRLGGDDTDFCLRLREAGGFLTAVPDAICYHTWETWASPLSLMRRSFRWGWMHSILLRRHPRFRRLDAPGLPVYTLGCMFLSFVGALLGRPFVLLATPLFLLLALLMHAAIVARRSESPRHAFFSDLALALVECPFGFGRTLGALSAGTLTGVYLRLDDDDAAMNYQFPEVVRDLWSDNIALLMTLLLLGLGGLS